MAKQQDKYDLSELREKLAEIEHNRWARWQEYYLSKLRYTRGNKSYFMGSGLVEHWKRQIETPYSKLSEEEKESDRKEVDMYLPLIIDKLSTEIKKAKIEALEELTEEISCLDSEYQGESYRKGFNEIKHKAIKLIQEEINKLN